eukprot:m.145195 g.145195  ORF g.145195 m.145195 type:complete len:875 (-) comp30427_c0_seq1:22-2646(-)
MSIIRSFADGLKAQAGVGLSATPPPTAQEVKAEKSTLYQKAADAVKEVQRRFNGKQDFATAVDSCVPCLCATIEAILLHGLKPPRKRGGEHTFWPAVAAIISTDDAASLHMLRNIRTDSGRGRAWVRWAFNEHSIEKYLKKICESQTSILGSATSLYYDYAFICDEDRMSMLTMQVVGLDSIEFAIEVDSANLDKVNEYSAPKQRSVPSFEPIPSASFGPTPVAAFNPNTMPVIDNTAAVEFDPMDLVNEVKSKKTKKKKKKNQRNPEIGLAHPQTSSHKQHSRSNSLDAALIVSKSNSGSDIADSMLADPYAYKLPPDSTDGIAFSLDSNNNGGISISNNNSARNSVSNSVSNSYNSSQDPDSLLTTLGAYNTDEVDDFSMSPVPLSTENAFSAIDELLAASDSTERYPNSLLENNHGDDGDDDQTDPLLASILSGAPLLSETSGAKIYEGDSRGHSRQNSRSHSPATIARMALDASRSTSRDQSRSESRTDSSDGMKEDDLRKTLVSTIRSKESLQEKVRTVEQQLQTAITEKQQAETREAEVKSELNQLKQIMEDSEAEQKLLKENTILKQQLKKYVAEAAQLKRANSDLREGKNPDDGDDDSIAYDDDDEPTDTSLNMAFLLGEGEQAVVPADDATGTAAIEEMQSHHERQILQLSEMHCELIALNERLQDQLRTRDQQVRVLGGIVPHDSGKIGQELVRTRTPTGPKPARITPSGDGSLTVPGKNTVVNIWIPSALLRGKGSESYHVYQIYFRVGDDEWNVYRRFTHFSDLHRQVQHIFAGNKLVFPKKKAFNFNRKGTKFVEERRISLELYMRQIVRLCLSQRRSPMVINPCKQTFCDALPFLKEKLTGVAAGVRHNQPQSQHTFGDL